MVDTARANAYGLIGPNAIIQVANVLGERFGSPLIERIFAQARLETYAAHPPQHMVREEHVAALHRALRETLGVACAEAVLWEAGLRTADYLLANRIPQPVQRLLRWLPAGLASRMLLAAIGRNAWTFAGSGTFRAEAGRPVRIAIANCSLCRDGAPGPSCAYFRAVFERIYQQLVSPHARATGDTLAPQEPPVCHFCITW